jgi:polyferredoxin
MVTYCDQCRIILNLPESTEDNKKEDECIGCGRTCKCNQFSELYILGVRHIQEKNNELPDKDLRAENGRIILA